MAGLDGQQRARTEQLGVPGFQGTQAGFGPSTPSPPVLPSLPAAWKPSARQGEPAS